MNSQQLKKFLRDAYLDISFDYKDMHTLIQPRGSLRYDISCNHKFDENDITFEELISTPFYDGKTILDISEEIEDLQEF